MKRNKHYEKAKEIRRIKKRLTELYRQKWTEWVPVEKPYHSGWWMSFKLRDDVARRDDAEHIQEAVDLLYSRSYVRNKKARAKWVEGPMRHRRMISPDVYESLHPATKKWIRWDTSPISWFRYEFNSNVPNYWLVVHEEKAWVTHHRACIPEVEREISYLNDRLYQMCDDHPYTGYKDDYHIIKRAPRCKVKSDLKRIAAGEEDIDDVKFL